MFSKDIKARDVTDRDRVPSIISSSLRIVGDLVSEGDVQVDGLIEGDVKARTLTVSEGAAVHGQINADEVCIRGKVEGQITAQKVELGHSARVSGDVVHVELSIESGAFLEGHCRHLEEMAQSPAQMRIAEAPKPDFEDGAGDQDEPGPKAVSA